VKELEMKRALLFGLAGLLALTSVVEVEAGHRHRCGGRHHRRCGRGACYSAPCQTPVYHGGCATYGGAVYGQEGYAPVEGQPAYDQPVEGQPAAPAQPVDPNVPPPAPMPPST
jgi:hypothetical protein